MELNGLDFEISTQIMGISRLRCGSAGPALALLTFKFRGQNSRSGVVPSLRELSTQIIKTKPICCTGFPLYHTTLNLTGLYPSLRHRTIIARENKARNQTARAKPVIAEDGKDILTW